MKNARLLLAPLAAVLALTSCQGSTKSDVSTPMAAAPAAVVDAASLLEPSKAVAKAPDAFKAVFSTTKGDFVIEVHRDWAPQGADRFYNLLRCGYYDDVAFFRNISGFMVQFGIHGRPEVNRVWREARVPDDSRSGHSNSRGMVTFATAGPGTRTTQLFINFGDNSQLDGMGFTPFGQVSSGMDVVDALNNSYGEGAPRGRGPDQGRIQSEGNAYLRADFAQLDYVKTARIAP